MIGISQPETLSTPETQLSEQQKLLSAVLRDMLKKCGDVLSTQGIKVSMEGKTYVLKSKKGRDGLYFSLVGTENILFKIDSRGQIQRISHWVRGEGDECKKEINFLKVTNPEDIKALQDQLAQKLSELKPSIKERIIREIEEVFAGIVGVFIHEETYFPGRSIQNEHISSVSASAFSPRTSTATAEATARKTTTT